MYICCELLTNIFPIMNKKQKEAKEKNVVLRQETGIHPLRNVLYSFGAEIYKYKNKAGLQ